MRAQPEQQNLEAEEKVRAETEESLREIRVQLDLLRHQIDTATCFLEPEGDPQALYASRPGNV